MEISDPQQGKVVICWLNKTFQLKHLSITGKVQMIKLRLKRFGKKREASFRLVACNSTSRRDGRPLQELGFYNPRTKETRLDTEALRLRLSQGAQPTEAVRSLLVKGGLLEKKVVPSKSKAEVSKDSKPNTSKPDSEIAKETEESSSATLTEAKEA